MTDTDKTFYIVEGGKLNKYIRRGMCNSCGYCCCGATIKYKVSAQACNQDPNGYPIADNDDWSEFEGMSLHWAQGLWWYWYSVTFDNSTPNRCEGYKLGKCTKWKDEDWPAICRYFPISPENIKNLPSCSFMFERAVE